MAVARPWRLLVLSGLWIALFRFLGDYAALALPEALRLRLTLEAYLTGVQLVTAAIGVGVVALVVGDVPRSLALRSTTSWRAPLIALLVAPLLFAVSQAAAVRVALPTLMEEIARGGRQLAEANSGRFGREVVTSPIAVVFVWGAVVSPVCEELVFRGALWSSIDALATRLVSRGRAAPPGDLDPFIRRSAMAQWLRSHRVVLAASFTTLVTAGLFAMLHAGMPGGLGIVRVAAAFGLGLGCGLVRQLTGTCVLAMALHAGFNTVSICATRRWFDVVGWGKWLWVPALVWVGGGLLALLAVVVWRRTEHPSG